MAILWPNGLTTPPNFSAEGHFGYRNSSAPGASRFHRGLDMWGLGDVRAIADGTVVATGWGAGYGWGGGVQVWIQHAGFFTRSLHIEDGSVAVRVGQRVTAGQVIGREGWTGTPGPAHAHLHLEVTMGNWHARNTGQIDPRAFLEARVNTGTPAATTPPTGGTPATTEGTEGMGNHIFYRHQGDGRVMIIAGGQSIDLSEKDCRDLIAVQSRAHEKAPRVVAPAPRFTNAKSFVNLTQAQWNVLRAVYPPRG